MKRPIPFIILLSLFITRDLKAQVWFPEGGYNFVEPMAFCVDNNNIYTIGKQSEDTARSYWLVARYDGKSWIKLPLLTLNKTAEILEIKQYLGSLYVAGNFTFDNGAYSSLIRFKDLIWQPVVKLRKSNSNVLSVSSLEIFENKLVIGGNFNLVGSDSIPYLAAYNGLTFSNPLGTCKTCHPGGPVVAVAANDSVMAVSGSFSIVSSHKSANFFTLDIKKRLDTLAYMPLVLDRLTINGRIVYGTGGASGLRKIIKIEKTIADIRYNIDSIVRVSQMVIFDNNLWINGAFRISGNTLKPMTLQLNGTTWNDFSNNYPGAKSITTARGSIWAIGNAPKPLSMWNSNVWVMRLFRNMAMVRARVFLDENNDCILNKTDKPLPRQLIKLAALSRYVITNEDGLTEFLLPNNQVTYKFEVRPGRNLLASNCADTVLSKTFVPNRYIDSFQFPLKRKPNISDLRIFIASPKGAQVVKDKKTEYIISCENTGSLPLSGSIVLKKNAWLKNIGALPAPFSSNDSVIEWSYSNLDPGAKKLFYYQGSATDPRFSENSALNATAMASISAGGNSYADDDIDSIQQTIDSDVNPFRKDIYPLPAPGDSITYLTMDNRQIRYSITFQNFGTDTVFNAVITDTLDLNLDISYIQETGSNKSYYTEIQTDPNNSYRGIVIWHFPNINLIPNPAKNFEQTASGSYIGFKIVMNPVSSGYLVRNTAAVFFDNTYSGKTNTAYCTIMTSGLNDITYDNNGILYPNPAGDQLFIKTSLNSGNILTIYNMQGVAVQTVTLTDTTDQAQLDIATLPSGLYMLSIQTFAGTRFAKFVKS